jgi:hypothetical protein
MIYFAAGDIIRSTRNIFVLVLVLTGLLYANEINQDDSNVFIGLSGGFSFANFIGKDADAYDPDFRRGLTFGGFLDIGINRHFSMRLEMDYIEKGSKNLEDFFESYVPDTSWHDAFYIKEKVISSFNLKYIEFPVLLNFYTKNIYNIYPRVFCGLSAALNFDARLDIKDGGISELLEIVEDKDDIAELIEDTDYGAIIGIGFDYKFWKLKTFLDIRYSMGLREIYEEKDPDFKNFVFTVTTGFGYQLSPNKRIPQKSNRYQ